MSILPLDTVLGTLNITDVYDFFDFPRLFIAKSQFGSQFLVLSVAEDEQYLTWLYLPISIERFHELAESKRSLYIAFLEPEQHLLKVTTRAYGEASIDLLKEAPAEWLPAEGEYLLSHKTTREMRVDEGILTLARQKWCDVLEIAFSFPGSSGMTAPLRPAGELFSELQQAVDTIAAAISGQLPERGSLPISILDRTQLEINGSFYGSFGVSVCSKASADIFGHSLVGSGIQELIRIVGLGATQDAFVAALRPLGPRGTSRLRVLFEAFDSAQVTVDLRWASPSPDRKGAISIGREDVTMVLRTLTSLEITEAPFMVVNCRLIGINIRTKIYEVQEVHSGRKYSGRIADEAMVDVVSARVNAQYKATIKTVSEINANTGEEKSRFILIELQPS